MAAYSVLAVSDDLAGRARVDVLDDRVAVQVLVAQRQQDLEDRHGERQVVLRRGVGAGSRASHYTV